MWVKSPAQSWLRRCARSRVGRGCPAVHGFAQDNIVITAGEDRSLCVLDEVRRARHADSRSALRSPTGCAPAQRDPSKVQKMRTLGSASDHPISTCAYHRALSLIAIGTPAGHIRLFDFQVRRRPAAQPRPRGSPCTPEPASCRLHQRPFVRDFRADRSAFTGSACVGGLHGGGAGLVRGDHEPIRSSASHIMILQRRCRPQEHRATLPTRPSGHVCERGSGPDAGSLG